METNHDQAQEHNRILMQLGHAAIATDSFERFEYRIVDGYPFLWVLHSGFAGKAMVMGYDHLLYLEHLGHLQIQTESLLPVGSFILTPSGLSRCAELDLFGPARGITAGPEASVRTGR